MDFFMGIKGARWCGARAAARSCMHPHALRQPVCAPADQAPCLMRPTPGRLTAAPAAAPAGKDFVMVCSDTSAVHSIITIKQDEDKILPVDSHKVFCVAGEAGDRVQFSDYVIANVKLYALRNATELSTKSVANYARTELANALRRVGGACANRGCERAAAACSTALKLSSTQQPHQSTAGSCSAAELDRVPAPCHISSAA